MSHNTVMLDKQEIDKLFAESNHQQEVIIGLYKMVIPGWDKIRKLHDYPTINSYTTDYIYHKFFEFDRLHHPNVLAGGCWMNSGFSVNDKLSLSNWEVLPVDQSKIQYINDKNPIDRIYINYAYTGKVRVCFVRKFTHNNYTVKHMAKFSKLLKSKGYQFRRLESNQKVCYFSL